MCVVDPKAKAPLKELSNAYLQWCQDQHEDPAQGRTFNKMLEERKFVRKQVRTGMATGKVWIGLRLKTDRELAADIGESEAPDKLENSLFSSIAIVPKKLSPSQEIYRDLKAG